MAGIIKKQILKHLSKFAKNLNADSIHLSTLKGEGELSNLELDCDALQNLVNLPTWLKINHATCNKLHVKIPWTKLKAIPITVIFDAVEVDMATCEKPRPPNGPSPIEASASSGDASYGFVVKVLEGIAVRINSINVSFSSTVFKAEFQLSQLLVVSTNPEWKSTDLRFTRILNTECGQVLTFKKVSWQTMRIVTDATVGGGVVVTTPIRLITNQAELYITLRRKISDLSMLASRLQVRFDDLLWVLTEAQVQSALLCVKSIREIIERAEAHAKHDSNQQTPSMQNQPQQPSSDATQQQQRAPTNSSDPYFNQHVIHESSFHVDVDRIDLHVCDDGSLKHDRGVEKIVEGGAILITFHCLQLDHYPAHKAARSRNYFRDYGEIAEARDKWADEIIAKFREDFIRLKKAARNGNSSVAGGQKSSKLVENCFIVRLGDMDVGQVSTSSDKEHSNTKMLSSQRKALLLPDDMPLLSAHITDYFFPDGRDYPEPHNNIFVRVTAPLFRVHWPTLLWCNQLMLTTVKSVHNMLEDLDLFQKTADTASARDDEEHVDIRFEALMPKIIVPSGGSSPATCDDKSFPDGIEVQISQAIGTNCRCGQNSSRRYLQSFLEAFHQSYLSKSRGSEFPFDPGHEYELLNDCFRRHSSGERLPINVQLRNGNPVCLTSKSLKQAVADDVWSIWLRQVWLNFIYNNHQPPTTATGAGPATINFIDSIPIMIWIAQSPTAKAQDVTEREQLDDPTRHTGIPVVNGDDVGRYLDQKQTSDNENDGKGSEHTKHMKRRKDLYEFYSVADKETGDKYEKKKPCAEMSGKARNNIALHIEKAVRVMLDHYQLMYLSRLAESLQDVFAKMTRDSDEILATSSGESASHRRSTPDDDRESPGSESRDANNCEVDDDSTAIRILLPTLQLHLVMRPVPESPDHPLEEKDLSPQEEDSPADTKSCSSSVTSSSFGPQLIDAVSCPTSSENSSETVSILGDDPSLSSPAPGDFPSIGKTIGSYTGTTPATSLPASPERARNSQPQQANVSKLKAASSSVINRSYSFARVSTRPAATAGLVHSSSDSCSLDSIVTSHNSDTDSLASSLDQFVVLDCGPDLNLASPSSRPDDVSDATSTSEASSENALAPDATTPTPSLPRHHTSMSPPASLMMDDSLITVNGDAFDASHVACFDEKAIQTEDDADGNNKVSVLRVDVEGGLEVFVDACRDETAVKLVACALQLKQLGNLLDHEAHDLFTTTPPPSEQVRAHPKRRAQVLLRIDEGRAAPRHCDDGSNPKQFLQLQARSVRQHVLSSSLANLGVFFEDERVPEVMPMRISAEDICLTIEDDNKPVYASSIKMPPLTLRVDRADVTRSLDGVFHVLTTSPKSRHRSTKSVQDHDVDAHDVNTHFHRQQPEAGDDLTQTQDGAGGEVPDDVTNGGPNDDVMNDKVLDDVRQELSEVKQERDSLYAALQLMQEDLINSEREREKLRSCLNAATTS